jgi:hypothetical protein
LLLLKKPGLRPGFFLPAIQALWVSGASVVAFCFHTKRPRRPDMTVKGTVCGYHARLPRYAIQTDHGFSVVDVLDGELAVYHQVTGALEDHGVTVLRNRTTEEDVEVCVEAVHASREAVEALLVSR